MIRQRMKELRGTRSQEDMAKMLKISQQNYSQIEQGIRGIKPKKFKVFELVFNGKIENLAPDLFEDKQ